MHHVTETQDGLSPTVKRLLPATCEQKECGDDGCGGSCGTCDDGHSYTADSCETESGKCLHEHVPCPSVELCPPGPCEELLFHPETGHCEILDTCLPPDRCHTAHCNPDSGACNMTEIPCPPLACKAGICNPETGKCSYASTCDDDDPCTAVRCRRGRLRPQDAGEDACAPRKSRTDLVHGPLNVKPPGLPAFQPPA